MNKEVYNIVKGLVDKYAFELKRQFAYRMEEMKANDTPHYLS